MGLNQGCGYENSTLKFPTIILYPVLLFAALYLWVDSVGLVLVIAQSSKRQNHLPKQSLAALVWKLRKRR